MSIESSQVCQRYPEHDKTLASVLGEIVWLMSQSPDHTSISIGDLERLVMAPILLRQMRIFYNGDQPAAAVLYARISEAVAARLAVGTTVLEMSLDDWQSGAIIHVMQVIAPDGNGDAYVQETLAVLGSQTAVTPN